MRSVLTRANARLGHNRVMDRMIRVVPGTAALVLDSPHSGVEYPEDFRYACEMPALRQAEDTHVEKLYDFAPSMGIAWIEALFPRAYLDANRNITEIDETMLDGSWPGELATAVSNSLASSILPSETKQGAAPHVAKAR